MCIVYIVEKSVERVAKLLFSYLCTRKNSKSNQRAIHCGKVVLNLWEFFYDFTFVQKILSIETKNFYFYNSKKKKMVSNYFIAKLVPASKNKTVTIDHFRHVKTKLFHHQRLAIYSTLRYIKRNCIEGNNRGYKSAANYFFTWKNQEWREKSTDIAIGRE